MSLQGNGTLPLTMSFDHWEVELHPRDKAKTAFVILSGLYEFEKMPSGLKHASATFQRLMQQALDALMPHACLVYLDDKITHGPTVHEHNERQTRVLEWFRAAGLILQTTKCHFIRGTVSFLGHTIPAQGVNADDNKIV